MSKPYRIFGVELSPYSIKVRAFFRYKGIPHEWVERSNDRLEEFKKYAKLPLVPLVVTPDDEVLQDSTPILEAINQKFPDPAAIPDDPALAFVSALLEEYGDEWGNKWMFHYRWVRDADIWTTAERLARSTIPDAAEHDIGAARQAIVERMTNRVWFVGSSAQTAPLIEASFKDMLQLLEAHLEARPFLLGTLPSFADFGLAAQLYEALGDPTAGTIMRETAPRVCQWSVAMQNPQAGGEYETLDSLKPSLLPLLHNEVGTRFLPWSDANAAAIAAGQDSMTVQIDLGAWDQKPQKYHARSLAAIRAKYAALEDTTALDPVLTEAGCLDLLR